MLTGVSILGLAVGFAAQETLANFIASIVIFWDKPFKVADWLTVDGVYGQVQRITFRSCRLLNLNGEVVIFPNTFVLANKVTNHTAHPLSRVTIPIGIAYKESIDKARAVLLKAIQGDQRIRQDPAPDVVVAKCGESSVDLELRFWIDDDRAESRMTYEYNEKVKEALDAAGIEIPFPHVQLMVEQTPAINALATRGNGAEDDKSRVRVN
jgi:small conductance mechanosensitive channel